MNCTHCNELLTGPDANGVDRVCTVCRLKLDEDSTRKMIDDVDLNPFIKARKYEELELITL